MALTDKQLAFINEYFKDFNATQAAIRAGYSEKTAYNIGWENVRKREIADVISRRFQELAMSADEVLNRLADIARVDMGDFVTFEDGIKLPFIDLKKAKDAGKLHLVKKIKYNAQGYLEFELHDPLPSLLNIGKHQGLFKETIEHSGELDLNVNYVNDWRDTGDTPTEDN